VTVIEQVRADMTSAMKSSERERASALRLVLSELQKAEKEGAGDELAVLRRERKRRLDAAEQFRGGGRPELADKEVDTLIGQAIEETGATSPKDMGQVMKAVMARAEGRADGKRVSARVREALAT
jgi:uncharacterized protein YqeY